MPTLYGERPGTTRGIRPSPTLWRWYAKSYGPPSGFVRVLYGRRDAKSPAGVYGQANRCALLRSLMAKVQLSMYPARVFTSTGARMPQEVNTRAGYMLSWTLAIRLRSRAHRLACP